MIYEESEEVTTDMFEHNDEDTDNTDEEEA